VPYKFADFWGFERNLVDIAEATTRGQGWNSVSKIGADLLGMVGYVLLALAGAAGFLFSPDRNLNAPGTTERGNMMTRWKILLGGFTLYFIALHLVIFGDGRFHLPLIPLLAIYAGWLVVALVQWRTDTLQRQVTVTRFGLFALITLIFVVVWAHEGLAAAAVLQTQ